MIKILLLIILGVILTFDPSWRVHTTATYSKMFRKLGALRCFGAALDVKTCAHLFKAFVKPDFKNCLPA